jgi:heme-degrading monooxygenase HmoA
MAQATLNTAPNDQLAPVILINIFTPKPGCMDEFIETQTAFLKLSGDQVSGWRGSRLHRAIDDRTAAMVTIFNTVDDHKRWMETDMFKAHRVRIASLTDSVEGNYYQVICEAGVFELEGLMKI